ncbi:MAG: GNAT family N-acetyltransferase [Nocardioidaceae bacterium]
MSTPGHHLWELREPGDDGDALVGHLWLAVRDRVGYLFDIELLPAARGRGLGRASMLAAQDAARSLGAEVLRLNVFGHNAVARHLYERLGYDVVSAVHTRVLEPEDRHAPGPGLVLTRPAQVNPGHEVWTAARDGQPVASACLHWPRTGASLRVEAHDLRAAAVDDRVALLGALVALARGRGAGAVVAETGLDIGAGADGRGWLAALETADFALTAQLREKRLVS